MTPKAKEYLKRTIASIDTYFTILDVSNGIVEVMNFSGTPFEGSVIHSYDEIAKDFSIVVIPSDDIRTENVKENYYHRGLFCQKITGQKYLWHGKELVIDLPQKYFNGKEFVDMPKDFMG